MKEQNKLLANFLNLETILFHGNLYIANKENFDLLYSVAFNPRLDWNDLMKVVDEIFKICSELDEWERFYLVKDEIPHIECTYNACIKFVNWYNNERI